MSFQPKHTMTGSAADQIADMEALAHLNALGAEIIERSVCPRDLDVMLDSHRKHMARLSLAYERKWKLARGIDT